MIGEPPSLAGDENSTLTLPSLVPSVGGGSKLATGRPGTDGGFASTGRGVVVVVDDDVSGSVSRGTVTRGVAIAAGPSPIWFTALTKHWYSAPTRRPDTVIGADSTPSAMAPRLEGTPVGVVVGDVQRPEKLVTFGDPLSSGGSKVSSTRPSSGPSPDRSGSAFARAAAADRVYRGR